MTEKKLLRWPFNVWIAVIGIGMIIGLWGAAYTLIEGLATWGIGDQVPWGVVTATYVFFVAASAGCVTISLGHALGIKGFELIIKRAILLAIVTLLAGGILIILHVGYPLNLVYFFISPNFGSPLGWMVVFYILYLVLLVIDFYLLNKNARKIARIIGILTPLAAIAVHSTLGAVFGFASVRTYFGGAFAPLYFILIAIAIGTALLLFVTTLQFRVTKKEMSPEVRSLITTLGKFLGIVLGVAILFILWKVLAGLFSSVETTALAYRYILFGSASWWYWGIGVVIGLIIPLFLLFNPRTRNLNGILVASAMVLIGMFAARFEYTLGGLIVGRFEGLQHLQWPYGSYSSAFVEVSVVVLAFAVSALLYTLGSKKLALEEVPRHV
jgi:molybdopterin-containing oxidoreductase family membrane subunit